MSVILANFTSVIMNVRTYYCLILIDIYIYIVHENANCYYLIRVHFNYPYFYLGESGRPIDLIIKKKKAKFASFQNFICSSVKTYFYRPVYQSCICTVCAV